MVHFHYRVSRQKKAGTLVECEIPYSRARVQTNQVHSRQRIEVKTFDAHDGQGLTLAQTTGLRTGCITGRESAALLRRAHEMTMEFIYMKQPVKMPAYEEILQKAGVSDSAVAYIGDDLPDIPLMHRAGLAVAVGDAVPEVKDAAHYTTKAHAGNGDIREAVELILKSKGIWETMIDKARA